MALGRLQLKIIVATLAHAVLIRDDILGELSQHPRAFTDKELSYGGPGGPGKGADGYHVEIDVRFANQASMAAMKTWVQGRWNAQWGAVALAGSRIRVHVCPHDEEPRNWGSCRNAPQFFQQVKS